MSRRGRLLGMAGLVAGIALLWMATFTCACSPLRPYEPIASLGSAMREVALQEEAYFSLHGSYAAGSGALARIALPPETGISNVQRTDSSYRVWLESGLVNGLRCQVDGGRTSEGMIRAFEVACSPLNGVTFAADSATRRIPEH